MSPTNVDYYSDLLFVKHSQSINGDSQSINGDSQSINGDSRSINGDSQSINGDSQSINGDSRSINREYFRYGTFLCKLKKRISSKIKASLRRLEFKKKID